ncbi:MAG: molybdenum ABC transporter ATP-binding protein [Rhodovibrionaceae bacterium]
MTLDVRFAHSFGGFSLDINFSAESSGITALFGPSGSGKSSTVNAIAGLLSPRQGHISLGDRVLFDSHTGQSLPARKRQVGYVFQDARLFPHMSVRANLEFGARRRGGTAAAREDFDHIVDLLGLGHLLARRPRALSGGEKQRVALGRAMLSRPRLLLLDEPLAAIDPSRKAEILPYFERLRDEAGVPIVYVSHSVDEVGRLADRLVVLNEGRVAAQGPVHEIMSRLDLFPLTGRFEAGAVIEAAVLRHEEADHLTEVGFDGGRLWVPRIQAPAGSRLRLRIRARDVMLALGQPEGISANNILRGTITEIRRDEGPYLDIRMLCGQTPLIARITHRSLRRLGLRPGLEIFAVIKSATVDRHAARLR